MSIFTIGFKQKLLLALIFSLIGFSLLSTLSISSLKMLVEASEDVDVLNQRQAHLFRLKLDMMEQVSRLNLRDVDLQAELDQLFEVYQPVVSAGGGELEWMMI